MELSPAGRFTMNIKGLDRFVCALHYIKQPGGTNE